MTLVQARRSPRERATTSTQVRHGEALGRLIQDAADTLGVDKSTFIRAALEREAARILEHQRRHVMTPEDAAVFDAALDRPVRSKAMTDAVRLYRSRVVYAD